MGRRKDPAAAVIEFFESAQPDAALAILGVCKAIVAKRVSKPGKPKLSGNPKVSSRSAAQTSVEND